MENNLKRFLSLLLALVMVIGLMPVGHVHAEEGNTINLVVGDTHEITLDGDYSSLNGTGNEVVSVDAEFTPKLTAYTVSNTTTDATLESGKYVLQNTRVSKFLESTSEGGKLWLAAKLITTAETWTITKVDDGYTMKASNGQYLTFDGSSSSLTDTETVLSFTWKDTSTWQIGCGGQYLNSYDSEQKVAGWWQDGDGGSQWRLYKVTDQPAYSWTLGDAVSQIEDGGYYIFENNEASSRAASLVSSKWNNTNNGGGGSGYGLLMEHNKTNFGEQDIWKITGTAGEYHVQDCHGWNLLVASGKATLTPESQTTVIGQDSTSYEGKWQISVGGVHLNWWGGSNGDGVQVAGWGDVNDRNSQWNIYEVIPTALGSTTIALTALKAGTAEITIGDTTYHIHVTDGTGEHEHSYTGEVTTAATCTENGEMTYTCVCGERYTEVIPATGHAPVTSGTKKPTLCEPGATGTTSCGVCGEVFSESTAINQLPVASVLHDNKIVALNGCEYTYNASNSSFTHTDANGTVYSVKPAAGVGVNQPALIPQTTAEVFSVSLIWGSGDFAGRVQISGNGSIHFHTNADKPYWNKCGSGSDENSDWTNHGLYLFVAGGDSAEFPGYTQVTSAEGMVDGGHYLIAARTDDDHGGKWYVMRPTAGTNEFMHVAQYTGMKEITGHTPGEKVRVNEVAATCGAAGSYDSVVYCSVCSAELSRETIAIDALGHKYETVVTAPTCTEPGYTTYTCTVCGDIYVADEVSALGHSYENGFCTVCGGYEAPEFNADGFYEIGNAGHLYWFADQVNNGANNINAILTDNIEVNENLMEKITIAEDGTATVNEGETIREWAPIGGLDYYYSGTFDGNGKTVTGLYRNVSAKYVGLIGYLEGSGKVQNVTVADSYFCGGNYVGGVVGYNLGTVSYCYSSSYAKGDSFIGGVVGYSSSGSTVSNCHNTGTVSGSSYVGGVVGFCYDGGTVSNCYNTGSVSGSYYVGGVVGYCYTGSTVSNCYNTGSVSCSKSSYVGGVVGFSSGTVTNCFYLDTCGAEGDGTAKTEAQFASGEVAWLLNGSTDEGELVWKQNIGTDAIPGFEGEIVSYSSKTGAYYNKGNHEHQYEAVVTDPTCEAGGYTTYTCSVCGDSYVADETSAEHSYENGFCTGCGGYEAPELNADGFYEIGNAGQLYWFAAQVNKGANNINAILTADIEDNENLMEKITIAKDGTATVNKGETIREWVPIGGSSKYYYSGTFDGNGKTVKGLYRNVSANYAGLIGYLKGSGKVQNVTVADSYFCGDDYVGGVVAYSCAGSTVSNCHNTGTVSGNYYVGGVAGWHDDSTLSNCYNTGTVSGSKYVGGVVGYCYTATMSNCYNTGTVSGSYDVGGVVGYCFAGGTVSNCYNTGSVSGSYDVGGVAGRNADGTMSNCYNTGTVSCRVDNGGVVGLNNGTVTNCFYLDTCGAEGDGTAKTEAQFASGEVAWLLNGSTDEGELVWKQNIGTDAIPGFEGEIVSYSSETGAYYNKGNQEHQYEAVVTDPTCTEPGYTTYTCSVCGDSYVADETPALGHSYEAVVTAPTCTEGGYTTYTCDLCGDSYVADETSALGHSYEKGFCTVCGGYEAPELNADGFYEIGNAGQLYWFAQKVNSGGNEINAILTDNIVVNENLMEKITIAEDGTATVNEGETIREWAPIGGFAYYYSGTFDGNGKTVAGLYRNVSAIFVGLIGYLEGSGKVQNVTVADSYFRGGNNVGGVVGYSCAGSTVSNCHNTGSVSGGDDVGGVVGNNGGSMTECCNAGTVSGSNYVGGVAGWNADSTLSNCYNTGTVSGNDYVGGVAGFCFTATLSNCYNTGTVSGGDYVGGVVGLNDDGGTVSNCYNTGSVSGGGYVGGVVGYCYIGGTVSNCYNTGSINAGMFNGGVVGVNNGTMSNCFYLDTCGAEGEGTAKSEAQFASGEVAWLLNGSTDEGELVWKQNIGTDAIPGFEGEIVSYSSKTGAYYNKGNHEHQYEAVVTDPTCTEPGYTTYTCTVCGDTYVGDETTALGHTASEAVKEHEVAPTLNSEGSYDSVVYCSVCSAELSRTTITVPALQGAVAQVNGVKYATLAEAIEKASGNMAVHMLSDVTEDIVIDKALILLMNSHTLYGQVKITGPNVQIQGCINTSTDPKGKIVAEGKDAIVIGVKDQKNENISVYANFVDVTSTTDCALLIYDGKATFNNSDLTSTSTSYAAVQGSGRDFGDVSMSLCNVTSEHEVAIYWPHVGTLTVNNDCTITGATGLYIKQGKANLYSCTVKGTGAQVAHKVNNNGGDSTGDAITIDKGATEPVVNTSANLISENGNLVGMYGGTVELFGANLTAKKNAIRMEDGVLTLRGMTINAGYCALFIRGGEVNMSGTTMNSTGDYAAIQGNGTCGGDVTIRSGTVSSANNIAIYWPGSGNLTVMDATVTGATAIYAKQGNVTISGGTFRATGEKADFSHSGNGAYATGDAVVLESCDYGTLTASITYGRFISDHGKAVAAYAQPGHTELSGFITGGHYNTEVDAAYLAEGYCAALTGEYYSVAQHYYFSEVTDPDCENGGYTTHTCGRCGASYVTDEIPALGHTEEVIPGKDATCTETGLTEGKKCTVCGETTVAQQEIPALGHKPGETVIENEKAATCTETGSYDTVVYCSVCSEELSRETVTVPALGHKDEDNNFECDVCGEDLCTEHVEEIVKGYAATCTEPGLTDGKKCTVCGETTVAQEEIPALGHNYEAVVTAPTCTEGGYTTYTCSRCDDTYTGDETTALGHTASEAVKENEKAASCTETGSYDSVVCCSVCSAEMSRETVTVDALGHKEEAIPGKDATCTETGLTEGKKCTVCGETTVAQQEIPALGHDWLEDGSCSRCEERKEEEMENPFVDVPADEYYLEPVLWAVGKGITSGTSENTFSPYRIITRGQAVTFLWRAMGSPEPAMTINPFVDVTETDYYYKAVLWAAEKGITAGVGDNRFAPGQECTRAQILTFLWVAMDKPASNVEVNFNDVHEGDYYYNAVAWAYENGITAGMGGGAFGVGILCTRAHVITFLYRAAA